MQDTALEEANWSSKGREMRMSGSDTKRMEGDRAKQHHLASEVRHTVRHTHTHKHVLGLLGF